MQGEALEDDMLHIVSLILGPLEAPLFRLEMTNSMDASSLGRRLILALLAPSRQMWLEVLLHALHLYLQELLLSRLPSFPQLELLVEVLHAMAETTGRLAAMQYYRQVQEALEQGKDPLEIDMQASHPQSLPTSMKNIVKDSGMHQDVIISQSSGPFNLSTMHEQGPVTFPCSSKNAPLTQVLLEQPLPIIYTYCIASLNNSQPSNGQLSIQNILRKFNLPSITPSLDKIYSRTSLVERLLHCLIGDGINPALDAVVDIKEPFFTLARLLSRSSHVKVPARHALSPSISNIVKTYLDTSRATILANDLPMPMLRIHSDGPSRGAPLWWRKSLGKLIPSMLAINRRNLHPSLETVDYHELNFSLRIKSSPNPTDTQHASQSPIAEVLAGVLTVFRDYSHLDSKGALRLLKRVIPEKLDDHYAGLLLGLGLCGALREISKVDLLNFLSCEHPSTVSTVVLATAASRLGRFDDDLVQLCTMHLTRRVSPDSEQLLWNIPQELASVSALALGLVGLDSGDRSLSNLLLGELYQSSARPSLGGRVFCWSCGVAIGLINIGIDSAADIDPNIAVQVECGLDESQISQLLALICEKERIGRKAKIISDSATPAAIIAITLIYFRRASKSILEAIANCASDLAGLSRLCHVLLRSLCLELIDRQPSSEPSLVDALHKACNMGKKEEESPSLRELATLMQATGRILAWSLDIFCYEKRFDGSLLRMIKQSIVHLRVLLKRGCLDYDSRHARLSLAITHDYLLLAGSLMCAGTGDIELFRLLSDGFADPLDYCMGRSLLQSLALAWLVSERTSLEAIRQHGPRMSIAFLLASILPMPGFYVPSEPAMHFSRLLFLILLMPQQGSKHILQVEEDRDGVEEEDRDERDGFESLLSWINQQTPNGTPLKATKELAHAIAAHPPISMGTVARLVQLLSGLSVEHGI